MPLDLQAERLYEQIELVRGRGSRLMGRLCIMSLVAYLAGERDSDQPNTASQFIRQFAIQLNDKSPTAIRQELKPFAPRIIGTNDPYDFERAELVHKVMTEEVWPQVERDNAVRRNNVRVQPTLRHFFFFAKRQCGSSPRIMARFQIFRAAHARGDNLAVATIAGELLASLVQRAPTQRWYWAKSLELLDRLCDVGSDQRTSRAPFHGGASALHRSRTGEAAPP
jgi:hypothetical protein